MITNLEKSLVEDISVLLSVLPQDDLAEVRVVDQSVNIDLVGHVDHLLFTGIQAESLHGIKSVLKEYNFRYPDSRLPSSLRDLVNQSNSKNSVLRDIQLVS